VEAANRCAGQFVLTIDDSTKKDIWGPAAQELLESLFLAAAVTPGRTLRDVSRWLDDPGSPTPAEFLDAAGYRQLASSLRGTQHGAPETRDGIYQTARTAARALHDEKIMAWLTRGVCREPGCSVSADREPVGGSPGHCGDHRSRHPGRGTGGRPGRRAGRPSHCPHPG
jgi:hypothetical protein